MFLARVLSILLAWALFSIAAQAKQVTLKSTSSSVELKGEFKSYKNGIYVIETDLGELEVDARTVTCIGTACPKIGSLVSTFSISGDPELINNLLVPLMESYSYSLDASIETALVSDTESTLKIAAKDGQKLANITVRSGMNAGTKSAFAIKRGVLKAWPKGDGKTKIIPVATDAVIAITSKTNPVKSISIAGLHLILSGTITNWKDLGGPDADIHLYLPQKTSGLSKIAHDLGLDMTKPAAAKRFKDLSALSKAVANDPYGLGLTSFSNLRTAKALSIVGSCGAYIRPNTFNIASGSYPATFYDFLQVNTASLPIFAREFISYLAEPPARTRVDRQGYPSLSVFESSLENQGNRIVYAALSAKKLADTGLFRRMLETLNGARQLSTVLRFTPDTKKLTPQSKAALDVLIADLFLGNYADQTIMIVGFTDQKGTTDDNKRRSTDAAKRVSDMIKNADNGRLLADLQIEPRGFGGASPLVCETTPKGTATNNRVEIWVKDNS
ncbi:MAG: phosphate ABC transporter substrate-binding/OmpA family protein [Rhodobacterales bacterium]